MTTEVAWPNGATANTEVKRGYACLSSSHVPAGPCWAAAECAPFAFGDPSPDAFLFDDRFALLARDVEGVSDFGVFVEEAVEAHRDGVAVVRIGRRAEQDEA